MEGLTMDRNEVIAELARTLVDIKKADLYKDYTARYVLVLTAVGLAARLGYETGFDVDLRVDPPGFPIVAYIELPAYGQVSWHMRPHSQPYDGHTTVQKYARIGNYVTDSMEV